MTTGVFSCCEKTSTLAILSALAYGSTISLLHLTNDLN